MMVQYALKKCSPGRIYHFHAARKYRLAACRAWFFAFAFALGFFQGISLSRATTGAAADYVVFKCAKHEVSSCTVSSLKYIEIYTRGQDILVEGKDPPLQP